MNRLFLKLAASYGYTWRSLYKTNTFLEFTKKEWSKRLSMFEEPTLDYAFDQCMNMYTYPPNLPQFIEQCKALQKRQTEFNKSPEVIPIASHEVAQAHLQEIKNRLNMQGDNTC
jgi:hypothetical protein